MIQLIDFFKRIYKNNFIDLKVNYESFFVALGFSNGYQKIIEIIQTKTSYLEFTYRDYNFYIFILYNIKFFFFFYSCSLYGESYLNCFLIGFSTSFRSIA